MNPIASLLLVLCTLAALVVLATWAKGFRRSSRVTACNIGEGTHEGGNLSKFADAAFGSRYLLGKFGSDVNHVALNGANDRPLGVIEDEAAAAEDLVNVGLLGVHTATRKCVASEAIALTDELYTAANGKVQNLPAGAGTYYKVGRPLQTAAADGDVIEFEPCYPVAVVVS